MNNISSHYIVCIHGIGVDHTVFGEIEPALKNVLSSKDQNTNYEILFYDYQTGSDEFTTYDFANGLETFLENTLKGKPLSKSDKISIVAHSQGGLVSYIWLYSLIDSSLPRHKKIFSHLDSIITLATPFWGSKMAEITHNIRNLWDMTGIDFFLPAGRNEVRDMSFLSDTIYELREYFSSPKYENQREAIKGQVRLLNIAAHSKLLGGFNLVVGEPGVIEGDTAVALPSARLDFTYTRDLLSNYEDGHRTKLNRTKKTEMAPYYLVNAVHHTIVPSGEYIPGIIQFPEDCTEDPYDSHPSFVYIWKHILGEELTQLDSEVEKKLYYFLLDINIRFDSGVAIAPDEVELKFLTLSGEKLPWHSVKLGRILDHAPDSKVKSSQHSEQIRFNYSGYTRTTEAPTEFLLIVSAPGHKTRFIESYVTPTVSTYIDINLSSN